MENFGIRLTEASGGIIRLKYLTDDKVEASYYLDEKTLMYTSIFTENGLKVIEDKIGQSTQKYIYDKKIAFKLNEKQFSFTSQRMTEAGPKGSPTTASIKVLGNDTLTISGCSYPTVLMESKMSTDDPSKDDFAIVYFSLELKTILKSISRSPDGGRSTFEIVNIAID
ncbi:hypothetical protein GCM10007301_35710 [Azorhizobium oxalatiphilum]|uniref:Uncharacterized protein n=2 Tax=Azorhizobium oxalatiphilum TaxID=980631 RepID=A0A917FFF8_9HYPH|nr:hypothetical protein GCM10007301_35710 [Azorhizobium oxalatiphilum]